MAHGSLGLQWMDLIVGHRFSLTSEGRVATVLEVWRGDEIERWQRRSRVLRPHSRVTIFNIVSLTIAYLHSHSPLYFLVRLKVIPDTMRGRSRGRFERLHRYA